MKKLALLMALAAAPAVAHDYTLGDLTIAHPMSFPSAGMTGAGYLAITNTGDVTDRLLAVTADFPRVELHESSMDADGMMRMEQQDFIEIAAGDTVVLQPGGLHVMFMGLSDPLEVGAEIPATLQFENAGEIDVVFQVEDRPAEGETMNHGEMDHD